VTSACEATITSMWQMETEMLEIVGRIGKKLLPTDVFVSIYFKKNRAYLQSSYILAVMGFVNASASLQRTVYEAILRGYFFIVEPIEAHLLYIKTDTDNVYELLAAEQDNKLGHGPIAKKLYKTTKDKQLYSLFCELSHPGIMGVNQDFPNFNIKEIETNLKTSLLLSYGSIQMFAEVFMDRFNVQLKQLARENMQRAIENAENQIPLIEPDKSCYQSKLKLKKGNFLQVLI
jgi:hypothetical protein